MKINVTRTSGFSDPAPLLSVNSAVVADQAQAVLNDPDADSDRKAAAMIELKDPVAAARRLARAFADSHRKAAGQPPSYRIDVTEIPDLPAAPARAAVGPVIPPTSTPS